MNLKVRRKGSLTTYVYLEGLEKTYKAITALEKGDLLERATLFLQKKAFLAMKNQYFKTKSNRIYYNREYLSKPSYKKIEYRLFDKMPPIIRKGSSIIEFQFWEGYTKLGKDLPHLKWQEKGTNFMIDSQPYYISKKKKVPFYSLYPITKKKAKSKLSGLFAIDKNTGKLGINYGGVDYLSVPHYSLRARNFIASGNFLIKTKGEKIVRDFIYKEIKKIRGF